MKKRIAMFLAAAAAFGAWAETWTDPDTGYTWTYRIDGDTAEVYGAYSSYSCTYTPAISPSPTGTVMIPSTLNGKPVTSIGDYAFYYCYGLTNVTIPDSVTSIGSSAFSGCSGLTSVTIGNGVTSIGSSAFEGCSGLTSVTIPDSVTSIGDAAFYYCSGLTSVTIPDSVTSIGYQAFSDCSGLTSVTIPDSVTSIGYQAFYGCSDSLFDTTTIPGVKMVDGWAVGNAETLSGSLNLQGVRGIGNSAFYRCSSLTSVTIPDSVTSIGPGAFSSCWGLTSVTIPDSVTSIGDDAFYGCSGLTSVTIPDSVTSIGDSAFRGCSGLTSVTIPDSVTSIGDDAFQDCWGLTSVTIPGSVTSIGIYAFSGCSRLTSFIVGDGNANYKSVNGLLLSKDGKTLIAGVNGDVTIPDSVTSIGYHAFSDCSGLTSVTIPSSVANIGDDAFSGCAYVREATVPGWQCNIPFGSVTNLAISAGTTSIGDRAFQYCSRLACVTMPESVTSIGERAFYYCSKLVSVTIPSSVANIGDGAFSGCDNVREATVPGWQCNISFGNVTNLVISAGTTNIMYNAFKGCSGLTSVTIPDSVTSIGPYAFEDCSGLTSVTIGNGVTIIGGSAFQNCSGLTSVTIPCSVTRIGENAFYGCSKLTSVTIPDSVTIIDSYAFSGCSGLTRVTIGDGVTRIANGAFSDCSDSLFDTTTIPGVKLLDGWIVGKTGTLSGSLNLQGVRGIGDSAFQSCSGLTSVTIPDSVTSIGDDAFMGCSGLTSVTIPDSVTSIGSSAFSGCRGLTSVTIPGSVMSIGDSVFESCSGLTSVTIGNGVTSIGYEAFRGCSRLARVEIPDSVTSIGMSAFYGCSGLKYMMLPDSVTSIGGYAFFNCRGLTSVTIPDGVTSIGNMAFYGCSGLTSVIIPTSTKYIPGGVFSGCSNVREVTVPGWQCNIPFGNVTNLVISTGTTDIENRAFQNCSALTSMTIPASVTHIGDRAFDGCTGLEYITMPYYLVNDLAAAFPNGLGDVEIVFLMATGGDAEWEFDRSTVHGGIVSRRSGAIGNDKESWIEMETQNPGRLSFWWKASSESDGNCVFDYAYLSIDGEPLGNLLTDNEEYQLEGVAIGGKTDWQQVVLNVTGEGAHTIRWTYCKDEVDEGDTGEDCVWLDDVEFTPLVSVTFDLGDGTGTAPAGFAEMAGTVVTLPDQSGFDLTDYVFDGWSDGTDTYSAGASYTMPSEDVTLTAQWIEKRFLTFMIDGGEGTVPVTIKDIPGAAVTLPTAEGFSKPKHTFVGWSDGSATYGAGDSYTVGDGGVEFTAVWQRNELSVSISSGDVVNGGTNDTQSTTISIDAWSNPSGGTPAIYYTLDASVPTTNSTRYVAPFVADGLGEVTVKAIAVMDNYFESDVATFTFTRLPYSAAECIGVPAASVTSGGDMPWFRVLGDPAHDGAAAMRSGAIGDSQSSYVEMTVRGSGSVSFWWRVSSQNKVRTNKHDYLSFTIDGIATATLGGGDIDWTNETCSVADNGMHTLRWTYLKDAADAANEDCAWLDDVAWTPDNNDPLPEIGSSAEVALVLAGSTDSRLVAHIATKADYDGFRTWVDEKGLSHKMVMDSRRAWFSYAIGANGLIDRVFGNEDVNIVSIVPMAGGVLTFDAAVAGAPVGAGASPERLASVFAVEGADTLSEEAFSTNSVDVTFAAGLDGRLAVSATPKVSGDAFFMKLKVYPDFDAGNDGGTGSTDPVVTSATVTFDANGGSEVAPVVRMIGSELGELPATAREGHDFGGWFTEPDNGSLVSSSAVVTGDVTYYAHWTEKAGAEGEDALYVDAQAGSDLNTGLSASSAKATIQSAVNAASEGSVIYVAAGTYAPFYTDNKSIRIVGKGGAGVTFVDGGGDYRLANSIHLASGSGGWDNIGNPVQTNTVVEGLTMQNLCTVKGGTIRRCVIRNNDCGNVGGAPVNCSVLENCLITGCRGMNGCASDGCLLRNCTITGNSARDKKYVFLDTIAINCIAYNNVQGSYGLDRRWKTAEHRLVSDAEFWTKNVCTEDPFFVDAANGDYRLREGSPCINAGDNGYVFGTKDLNGDTRIVGGCVDIGCYESDL